MCGTALENIFVAFWKNGQKITFVDTPGHAAFSAMRARGSAITDIVIIVVAADDGVKPQTEEVISHAKASGCPIIVAINKMDKETANPDMVKAQMAERDLTPIDWGGNTEFIGVSALTGEGIEDLLENILIQAELLELKADPTAKAKAAVVESSLEKGRGPVANIIVQNGTLRIGDNIVCDTTFGRVKAITDDNGNPVKELGLSETGTVLGLNDVPTTGSVMVVQDSDKEARDKKLIIRFLNNHTSKYVFRILMLKGKGTYLNKKFFRYKPPRSFQRTLAKRILDPNLENYEAYKQY